MDYYLQSQFFIILSRMRILSFLLFFTFLILTKQCSQCVQIKLKNCQVCYQNCGQGQIFKSCTQNLCVEYYDDSDGERQCSQYMEFTNPQEECFSACCRYGDTQTPYFSVQALNKCKEQDIQSSSSIIIGVVISIVVIIVLVGIIIYTSWLKRRETSKMQDFMRKYEGLIHPDINQWQRQPAPCQGIQNSCNNCTICLDVQVDTVTNCGHFYHLKCLINWIQRNPACPLCKGQNFNPVKLYCRSCYMGYYKLSIDQTSNYKNKVQKIRGPNCPICK